MNKQAQYLAQFMFEEDTSKISPPNPALFNGSFDLVNGIYEAVVLQGADGKSILQAAYKDNPLIMEELGIYEDMLYPEWDFVTPAQMDQLEKPGYLYEDELVEKSLHVLYGQTGIGKTFVALDYALSVAQNHEVFYFASEGFLGYPDRIHAWCNENEKTAGNVAFVKKVLPILEDKKVDAFIFTVKTQKRNPDLIIIDTLAWAMSGGDENSSKDMQKAMDNCRKIQEELGTAILLVHHTGKSGASERGSSALKGAADVHIKLTERDETLILTCEKSKDSEPFEERYLRLVKTEGRPEKTSCVTVPANEVGIDKDTLTDKQLDVLRVIAYSQYEKYGCPTRDIVSECRHIGNVNNLLHALKRKGFITQKKSREPYFLSDKGKAYMAEDKKKRGCI